jgi:hypothetical protein
VAIVAHGLGQPEEGALVVAGLGVSETNPNALRAVLSGSSSLTANLTDGAMPEPPAPSVGSPGFRGWVIPVPPQGPKAIPGRLHASLTGGSSLTAAIDFTIDPDQLAYEFSVALLLDLV